MALVVLALAAGAFFLTMRSSGTSPANVIPPPAAVVPNPVKSVLPVKSSCQNDAEGHDQTGQDAPSGSCNSEGGDENDSGSNENEPDEKDSGD